MTWWILQLNFYQALTTWPTRHIFLLTFWKDIWHFPQLFLFWLRKWICGQSETKPITQTSIFRKALKVNRLKFEGVGFFCKAVRIIHFIFSCDANMMIQRCICAKMTFNLFLMRINRQFTCKTTSCCSKRSKIQPYSLKSFFFCIQKDQSVLQFVSYVFSCPDVLWPSLKWTEMQ